MLLFLLLTKERLFDLIIAITIIIWGIYKKECQDLARSCVSGLHQRFFLRNVVLRLTEKELEQLRKADLGPLRSWCAVLSREYQADRVTVTEYSKVEAGYLATCLAEVIELEMSSIIDEYQGVVMEDSIMDEILRIHNLPGRHLYVLDVRTLEVVTLRDVLRNSDVRSAFYQSLPTSKGKPWAILAVSWRKDHPLSPEKLENLHYSAMACAFILQSTETWKKTRKK